MSISPSAFVDAVRAKLIPRLIQDEIRYTPNETGGCVMLTAESTVTHAKVEVDASGYDGETCAMIIWGDYNLEIRTAEDEIVLFVSKGARSSADAAVFDTLDALFERVLQMV
jgi:hypothetical protein